MSPVSVATPAAALTDALAGRADVVAATGCQIWQSLPEPPLASLTDPVDGQPGVRLEFRARRRTARRRAPHVREPGLVGWRPGRDRLGPAAGSIVLTTSYRAARPAGTS